MVKQPKFYTRHDIAMTKFSPLIKTILLVLPLMLMNACSTNPATGESQFTGFMPAASEARIGAQEHQKILQQYGGTVKDPKIQAYVTSIGQKIIPHTERNDVQYTFTVLDSPVVNAFALPGGYVYITRGILALANNEAELAAVMAHEIGHVTARHSAERYSHSILTSLGATILSAAVDVPGAGDALGLGANLYLSSYSRSQEHQADDLGVRYIARAGYDPRAMSSFLAGLQRYSALEAKEAGRENNAEKPNYFATHPVTGDRIAASSAAANNYQLNGALNREAYMRAINGMEMGDSAAQGFMVGNTFVHPDLGFKFTIPAGYRTQNTAAQFIAAAPRNNGPVILFESGRKAPDQTMRDYLVRNVMKNDTTGAKDFNDMTVNNMRAATVQRQGTINGKNADIRIVAVEWDPQTVFQFYLAMPQGTTANEIEDLKKTSYSLARLTNDERQKYQPKRLLTVTAKSGDTVQSLSRGFPYADGLNEERFRVLNALTPADQLKTGEVYKVIVQ